MSRSVKKGPYVNKKLERRIEEMNADTNKKKPLKTWCRSCTIMPSFIGHTINVHNGRKHIPVYIKDTMVGHKLGEFAPTRTFKVHGGVKAIAAKGKKG
jgi:small subunit ribosomal protein S19